MSSEEMKANAALQLLDQLKFDIESLLQSSRSYEEVGKNLTEYWREMRAAYKTN